MKKLFLAVFLVGTVVFGQAGIGDFNIGQGQPIAHNAHEFALSELKEAVAGFPPGKRTHAFVYILNFKGGKEQSFTVDPNGTIHLYNITMRDALLLMAGDAAQKSAH